MAQKLTPFFSIIIPALNEAKYLPSLLGDLTSQTFRDFEVIVVDGHSDDATVSLAKSFATKLPSLKIINSSKRHVCRQRNLGAKHAHADWLIFMDADNRLPTYFFLGVKYRLESDPADLATCYLMSDSVKPIDKNFAKGINYAIELLKHTPQARIMESLVIIKRSAFVKIGGFDEKIDYAEGNNLLQTASDKKLRFQVYHDPSYTHSFRRFRKFGHLNMVSRGAQLEFLKLLRLPQLRPIFQKLYPMEGGKLFDQKHISTFSKRIIELIDTLKQ